MAKRNSRKVYLNAKLFHDAVYLRKWSFVPLIMFAAWFWHSFSLSHDNLFSLFLRWKPIKHRRIRESYTALEKTPSWFQFAGIFLPRQLKGSSKKTFIRGAGVPLSVSKIWTLLKKTAELVDPGVKFSESFSLWFWSNYFKKKCQTRSAPPRRHQRFGVLTCFGTVQNAISTGLVHKGGNTPSSRVIDKKIVFLRENHSGLTTPQPPSSSSSSTANMLFSP